jgi:hypothetical protein
MQTADWALVISILSAAISLAGFVWNVWSKFIYPKPRVDVHFSMVSAHYPGRPRDLDPVSALCLSATNMGPSETTLLSSLIMTKPHWFSERKFALLNVLQSFPETTDYEAEYYAPRRLRLHWLQRFLWAQALGAASGHPHYPSAHPRGLRQIGQGLAHQKLKRTSRSDGHHWGKRKLMRQQKINFQNVRIRHALLVPFFLFTISNGDQY